MKSKTKLNFCRVGNSNNFYKLKLNIMTLEQAKTLKPGDFVGYAESKYEFVRLVNMAGGSWFIEIYDEPKYGKHTDLLNMNNVKFLNKLTETKD